MHRHPYVAIFCVALTTTRSARPFTFSQLTAKVKGRTRPRVGYLGPKLLQGNYEAELLRAPLHDIQFARTEWQGASRDILLSVHSRFEDVAATVVSAALAGATALSDAFSHIPPRMLAPLLVFLVLDAVVLGGAVAATVLNVGSRGSPQASGGSAEGEPYGPAGRYNPTVAAIYFWRRPVVVVSRALRIGLLSSGFLALLLLDFAGGQLQAKAADRADQLVGLLTVLGPSFIKVGQSLSIRSDLLSPTYLKALTGLQDKVPEFSSDEARRIIEVELGRSVDEVFSSLSAKPVAAASLGQVYRGRTRSGTEVAVKVQRPAIKERIALDMFLIRTVAPFIKAILRLSTDVVGTIDDWGLGFIDELDYSREAANSRRFSESIALTPLGRAVFAPQVVPSASTGRVLTTEWVVGERLEKSAAEDVTKLCSICMNTYLTMLLETGMLHCDPHPGNLLRTPTGRVCILDWGMVTEVNKDLQLRFIEHVAHLTSKDYAQVPADLVALGFVPTGKEDAIQRTDAVAVLTEVYTEFAGGGGAAKIDLQRVLSRLQGLSNRYGNLFQVPPYFAYIARAFGVLEGIGLSADPSYAIVGACLPYISQRLLTDTNPRVGGALSNFVFGPDASNPDRVLDPERLELILEGFGKYSASTAGLAATALPERESLGDAAHDLERDLEPMADALLDLLLSPEQSPLQGLVMDQTAKVAAAALRAGLARARNATGVVGALVGADPALSSLLGGRSLLDVALDPLGLFRDSPLWDADDADRRALKAANTLAELLAQSTYAEKARGLSGRDLVRLAAGFTPKVWARRSAAVAASGRFAGVFLNQQAGRLERKRTPTSATGDVPFESERPVIDERVSGRPFTKSFAAESQGRMEPSSSRRCDGTTETQFASTEDLGPSPRLLKARELLLSLNPPG